VHNRLTRRSFTAKVATVTETTDAQGRPEPPLSATEAETLIGFLDFQRATLLWKTEGIADDALHLRLPGHPSTMTLGGLLSHLAWVEDYWFTEVATAAPPPQRWSGLDWDADPDAEWTVATGLDGVALRTIWQESVDRSRTVAARVLTRPDMGLAATHPAWGGRAEVSLRWILVHMIEEYARHNGHADLLRELIDGLTGE